MTPEPSNIDEKCALVWGYGTQPRHCDYKNSCGMCLLQNHTRLMMKGLCDRNTRINNDYDLYFFVKGLKNGW